MLASKNIAHYIENIKDSKNDPIYSETPKTPSLIENIIETPDIQLESKESKKDTHAINQYFLSQMFIHSKQKNKMYTHATKQINKQTNRIESFEKNQT